MSPAANPFRLSDYFWPFGVSLLCGCASLYLASHALFALGISLAPWHGVAFVSMALAGGFFAMEGAPRARVKKIFALLGFELFLCGILAGTASRFDDLTVDGMNVRIEPTINLMAGWNPVLDPHFSSRKQLAGEKIFLKGGYNHDPTSCFTLSGYLALLTGQINAGKAVTPILGLAAFGIAFGGLLVFGLPRGWTTALAALAALNPVVIYQSSCFYVDGHVAACFTMVVFGGLRVVRAGKPGIETAVFFLSLLLLAGAKLSGFFYGGILFLLFFAIWAARFLRNFRILSLGLLLFAAGCGLLFLAKMKGGFGGLTSLTREKIREGTSYADGIIGYKEWAPGLGRGGDPGRLEVFFNAHFSPSAILANEPVRWKFPFWLTRPELAIFEDLSPQPYVGGFGPLYGAYFALSALSLILLRKKPPLLSWVPLVASFGSIYFSQIWWARWTPQAWLIPLGFLLPVVCSLQSRPNGRAWWLPFLGVFAGTLNSALILAFYTSGCLQAQRILQCQLDFLHALPQPLQIHFLREGGVPLYRSNRIWLIRENLDFVATEEPLPRPRMKFHRSTTTVALPPDWRARLNNAKEEKLFRKSRLLEE